jgi:hypothetical protein
MYDDETPHEMFNRLKKLVNKVRALGSKKSTDRMLIERIMMAYTPMNYNVVSWILQDPTYKNMISDDVLGRIMNHEMIRFLVIIMSLVMMIIPFLVNL